mmetsp:Transcript_9322/g.13263  ORF Transcript_9322/g.13263 Transcript_9322/m.13263 type:complete len:137 (-) Transcript_9322:43-453(-)
MTIMVILHIIMLSLFGVVSWSFSMISSLSSPQGRTRKNLVPSYLDTLSQSCNDAQQQEEEQNSCTNENYNNNNNNNGLQIATANQQNDDDDDNNNNIPNEHYSKLYPMAGWAGYAHSRWGTYLDNLSSSNDEEEKS